MIEQQYIKKICTQIESIYLTNPQFEHGDIHRQIITDSCTPDIISQDNSDYLEPSTCCCHSSTESITGSAGVPQNSSTLPARFKFCNGSLEYLAPTNNTVQGCPEFQKDRNPSIPNFCRLQPECPPVCTPELSRIRSLPGRFINMPRKTTQLDPILSVLSDHSYISIE